MGDQAQGVWALWRCVLMSWGEFSVNVLQDVVDLLGFFLP